MQVNEALNLNLLNGGRLGENLIASGAITQAALDAFLHRVPFEPQDIPAIGIDEKSLLSLLIKLIYVGRLESPGQMVDAIKLAAAYRR
jgi:hypothetical protein